MALRIAVPTTAAELNQVRVLMRTFTQWHRQRHSQDLHLIDQYFDAPAFDAELASLPGKYAPPQGQLLLATLAGEPAGCVALHKLNANCCEMKRMFVPVHLHGKGVGRALAHAILLEARSMGFKVMRLDTSIRQREAQALYESLGFRLSEPYYPLSQELRRWLVFMEMQLQETDGYPRVRPNA